jgi:hypothetical protein
LLLLRRPIISKRVKLCDVSNWYKREEERWRRFARVYKEWRWSHLGRNNVRSKLEQRDTLIREMKELCNQFMTIKVENFKISLLWVTYCDSGKVLNVIVQYIAVCYTGIQPFDILSTLYSIMRARIKRPFSKT